MVWGGGPCRGGEGWVILGVTLVCPVKCCPIYVVIGIFQGNLFMEEFKVKALSPFPYPPVSG